MSEKARILFVDDEPHILRGLRRLLLEWEDQWDTVFCTSGQDALEEMAHQPADVLVSDMRMPKMDGAQLLELVRERFPATIRVILSGYAETEAVMKTVGPAHIYIAKPCDPDTLCAVIAKPLALRRLLAAPALQAVIGEVASLPSLPESYLKIREELRSSNASPASVATLLSRDVAMTAEILKLTNSSFFGLGARVSSALQAVRTLGMDTIQALVLEAGLFRQFNGNETLMRLLGGLNEHSLVLGQLAEQFAAIAGGDEAMAKNAQCAAILSCIGWLVLLDRYPDRHGAVLAEVEAGAPLPAAERKVFGVTHHLVGAYLLGLWSFDDEVVEAVAFAAEPGAAPGRNNRVLAAVHAATALGPHLPLLSGGTAPPVELDMAYLIEARQDGYVRRWQALAEKLGDEDRNG